MKIGNYRVSQQDKKYTMWGIVAVIIVLFGKKIYDIIVGWWAKTSSKSDIKDSLKENLPVGAPSADNIRFTFVTGVIDSVIAQVESAWYVNTDETLMVTLMNSLAGKEEAIYASTYFAQLKGKSLKAYLTNNLNANWRGGYFLGIFEAGKTTFNDIKAVVRNFLL